MADFDLASGLWAIRAVAAAWAVLILVVFFVSGKPDGGADRGSRYGLMITLSAFLPTIGLGGRWDEEGFGFAAAWFPSSLWWGLGLLAAGLALRLASMLTLGRRWSPVVALDADHELIRRGPYRFLRHPIYLALLLEVTAFGVALANLWIVLLLVVPNAAALTWRIAAEEKALAARFGAAWTDYARTTKRLIPGVF